MSAFTTALTFTSLFFAALFLTGWYEQRLAMRVKH